MKSERLIGRLGKALMVAGLSADMVIGIDMANHDKTQVYNPNTQQIEIEMKSIWEQVSSLEGMIWSAGLGLLIVGGVMSTAGKKEINSGI